MADSLKRILLPAVAYLIVVGMSAFAVWQIRVTNLDARAADCVAAWATAEATRDMGEKVYRRNAETLIGLAGAAFPERIAAYRELVERDVVEIRATLPDPECDLDAARRRLG